MFSPEYIRELSDEAARRAEEAELTPHVIWDESELANGKIPRFPNIGSYRPVGWRLVDDWLCDKTGWGADDEPALTLAQLHAKLVTQVRDDPRSLGYAIIEEGQFQIVLGVFERDWDAKP